MSSDSSESPTTRVDIFSPEFAACPQKAYSQILRECPVSRSQLTGAWVLSRYEDVRWALRHPEIFSSEMDMHTGLGTERPMIPQQIDPPRQTRFRKILDQRFSRKRVLEIEPKVREHARLLIDSFFDAGECEFDAAFAIPLPCTSFLEMMGLPVEELDLFVELKNGIIRPPVPFTDLEGARAYREKTGKRIYAYFDGLIEECRSKPRDDIMTHLVTTEMEGRRLEREEILDICFLFLLGGLDTVTASLGCSIAYLAEHADQRQRLLDHPDQLDEIVEELLRWETPVTMVPRLVKEEVTIGGQTIPAGTMVTLLLGAADIDGEEFDRPEEVEFGRERNRHLAFGGGPHRCLGSHLARMELRVAIEEWHRRIPHYRIKEGETPQYSAGIREVQYLPLVWDLPQGDME